MNIKSFLGIVKKRDEQKILYGNVGIFLLILDFNNYYW